jgi:hypothetical protein
LVGLKFIEKLSNQSNILYEVVPADLCLEMGMRSINIWGFLELYFLGIGES